MAEVEVVVNRSTGGLFVNYCYIYETNLNVYRIMAKTTLQDICDVAALKSLLPTQPTSMQDIAPESNVGKATYLQIDNPIHTKTKKPKKVKESKILVTSQSAVTRNIILGNVSLRRKWSDFLMAEYLFSKGFTISQLASYQKILVQSLSPERYANIKRLLAERIDKKIVKNKQMPHNAGSSMVTRTSKVTVPVFKEFPVERGAVTKSGVVVTILYEHKPLDLVIPTRLEKVPSSISCRLEGTNPSIDEYWLYSQHDVFSKGKFYQFKVIDVKKDGVMYLVSVIDRCHNNQEFESKISFMPGDEVVCRVDGLRKHEDHMKSLILSNARMYKHAEPERSKARDTSDSYRSYPNNKRPEDWFREVDGLGKHTATSPFVCSCCKRSFSARHGCKIEMRDIYFCKECADQVFKHSDKGYIRIVYTPMGNKR